MMQVISMSLFNDWICQSCGSAVSANELHGKEQGCENPSPLIPSPVAYSNQDRERWIECQNRLADYERLGREAAGTEQSIPENFARLTSDLKAACGELARMKSADEEWKRLRLTAWENRALDAEASLRIATTELADAMLVIAASKASEDRAFTELVALRKICQDALMLIPGWREAIVMLEDFCGERVRLKNMVAAADQLDDFKKALVGALPAQAESKEAQK